MPETRITLELKRAVIKRAYGCCEYCRSQARFATQSFSIEHIVPLSQGGQNTVENLALACQGCNNHKYKKVTGRDPISGEIVLLFHPRNQNWNDHFAWSENFTHVIGLTSVGRATMEALQLNRAGLINLRRILYSSGEHPPDEILR